MCREFIHDRPGAHRYSWRVPSVKFFARSFLSVTCLLVSTISATGTVNATTPTVVFIAQMSKAHLPQGPNGGTDDYHCFLVDPKITRDSLITQIEFKPQQRVMMHHAIMFLVGKKDLAAAKAADNHGAGWSCFGGTGIGSGFSSFLTSPWISTWLPGRDKDVLPTGYGTAIAKGAQIVLQIHYNLLAMNGKKIPTDQSKVVITAVPAKGSHLKILNTELIPAPVELACPEGVTGNLCDRENSLADMAARTSQSTAMEAVGLNLLCGNFSFMPNPSTTSTCDHRIEQNESIVRITPHMHLLGRSLKVILNPDTPGESTLLDEQNYDFDNQSPTILKVPVQVKSGDNLRIICKFDPTLRQMLPELKSLPPRYVTWGEGSSDEMCLGIMGVAHQA